MWSSKTRKIFFFGMLFIVFVSTIYLILSKFTQKEEEFSVQIQKVGEGVDITGDGTVPDYGFSVDENFPQTDTGISRHRLYGILAREPYLDRDGFLNFELEIPAEGEKSKKIKVITFSPESPDGKNKISLNKVSLKDKDNLNRLSEVIDLEKIPFEPDFRQGNEVVLVFLFSKEESVIKNYYESLNGEFFEKAILYIPESFKVYEYVNGSGEDIGDAVFFAYISHVFIKN